FSVVRLSDTSKYGQNAFKWTARQYVYFGAVAGRVSIDDLYKTGNGFYNIKVQNVNTIQLVMADGYVGTFFGWDSGIIADHYNTEIQPVRRNLEAENINITATQRVAMILPGHNDVYMGGFVGAMYTYMPLVYEDCHVTDITLVCERDITGVKDLSQAYAYGIMGDFVAMHSNGNWSGDAPYITKTDGFKNCSVHNYLFENRSNDPYDENFVGSTYELGSNKSAVSFTESASDYDTDGDKTYGFFYYRWDDQNQLSQKNFYVGGEAKWKHLCVHECEICGGCLNETCTEEDCADKCLKHGDDHVCLSKCPICGKCYNQSCTEENCKDKCPDNHTELLTYEGLENMTFTGETTVYYDGNSHTLTLSNVPSGVEVAYEWYKVEGQTETKLEEAPVRTGEYKVVAKFTVDRWHNAIEDKQASFTIAKGKIDMSGAEFTGATAVTYDGSEHALTITGTNVAVTYEYYKVVDGSETKLEDGDLPVNAGTYKVVAVFEGAGEDFEDIKPMQATLQINKASISVTLGAKTNADGTSLGRDYAFLDEGDNTFGAYYSPATFDFKSYTVELLSSDREVECKLYSALNGDGTVDTAAVSDGKLTQQGQKIYALITLKNAADKENYQDNVVYTVHGGQRIVHISTYEQLLLISSDIDNLAPAVRIDAQYILDCDIDCGGKVWKTVGAYCVGENAGGAANDLRRYEYSFLGEFDGKGHKVYNFSLANDSVSQFEFEAGQSVAIGFFGYITSAKIHDVEFANVTVNINSGTIEGYQWVGNNPVYFGVVAGEIDLDSGKYANGKPNDIYNIKVTDLTASVRVWVGDVGVFFGRDNGTDPWRYNGGWKAKRENLVGSNISMTVTQALEGAGYWLRMGGFVGSMMSYAPLYYNNCALNNVTLIAQGAYTNRLYNTSLGGFAGYYSPIAWGDFNEANPVTTDQFNDCALTNYLIMNKSNTPDGKTDLYVGWKVAGARTVEISNATLTNGTDKTYGLYRTAYDGAVKQYVYDADAKSWSLVEDNQ
ncbi:MAG: hypothetical protein NC332_04375, partial [Firmicutes bacterium]|nr:hypothetical protein [Bacillota bacterium]